jgi:hypothetical protein
VYKSDYNVILLENEHDAHFSWYSFEYVKVIGTKATIVEYPSIPKSSLLTLLSASYDAPAMGGGGGGLDGKPRRRFRKMVRKADVTKAAIDMGLNPKGTIDEVLARVAALQMSKVSKARPKRGGSWGTISFCRGCA